MEGLSVWILRAPRKHFDNRNNLDYALLRFQASRQIRISRNTLAEIIQR